eukprot:454111-Prymnesium_polylepis.1
MARRGSSRLELALLLSRRSHQPRAALARAARSPPPDVLSCRFLMLTDGRRRRAHRRSTKPSPFTLTSFGCALAGLVIGAGVSVLAARKR